MFNYEKFIFSADWHVKLYTDKVFDNLGIPLKLTEVFAVIESMCKYAYDNGIPDIVVGGDINDLKGNIHTVAFA